MPRLRQVPLAEAKDRQLIYSRRCTSFRGLGVPEETIAADGFDTVATVRVNGRKGGRSRKAA